MTQTGQPMGLHRFWDGVITSSSNLTRLRNEATALRSRQEFQRSQLTELASTHFELWAKESFDIATKDGLPQWGRIDEDGFWDHSMYTFPTVHDLSNVVVYRNAGDHVRLFPR